MNGTYWSGVLSRRLTRRRSLSASGGLAVSAAILAACGSDKEKGDTDKSSLLSPRVDTSAKAVAGGIWPNVGADASSGTSLDPYRNAPAGGFTTLAPVYSTLVKFGLGSDGRPPPPANSITGDAAQSWEVSPDGLQVTYKLRANHKFDARPPTNGRAMTAEDVKFSWDRFVGRSIRAGDILHAKNAAGPIESLSTPDAQTVVLKLAFPYASINEIMAYWYLYVMPTEAEGKFDPLNEARGTGPFIMTRYDLGSRIEYRRNPDWYVKNRPFLEGMDKINVPEYASALAQFESKAIWMFTGFSGVKPDDILRVKHDHPEMDLFQPPLSGESLGFYWTFSQREKSPFRDVRLRRAASMAIDRDLFIDTFFNVPEFRSAGLPVETYWYSHLFPECANYTDPRGKDLGEGAKYFKHDVAEAKKLVAAAGLTDTVDFLSRATPSVPFRDYPPVTKNMLEEAGFKLNHKPLDAGSTWRQWKESGGQAYDGIFFNICHGFNDDTLLVDKYTPLGTDTISKDPIPGITDQVMKIRTEIDLNKKNSMIKQLEKVLAEQMLDIMIDDQPRLFELKWPWIKNVGVSACSGFMLETSSARPYLDYWYDASLKT